MEVLVLARGDYATVELTLSLAEFGALDAAGKGMRRELGDVTLPDLVMPASEFGLRRALAQFGVGG